MKISFIDKKEKMVPFEELKTRDTFLFCNQLYMKIIPIIKLDTENHKVLTNAVGLSEGVRGLTRSFDDNENITPVESELICQTY